MREFARVPDYLVQDLVADKVEEVEEDRTASQESIWTRIDLSGVPMIVRTAKSVRANHEKRKNL